MRKEPVSVFLNRAMLALFIALCALVLVLGVTGGLRYAASFVLALAVLAALRFFLPPIVRWLARLGPLRAWLLLSALCLILKLAWVLAVRVPVEGDYSVFWAYANTLAAPEFTAGSRYIALFPHIFGYSFFLSGFIGLFGPGALLAQGLNVALTLCAGTALFHICRRTISLEAALSVYLFWIACPSQTIYNGFVLSEPLYTTLILVFLVMTVELERREKTIRRPIPVGAAAGALGGLLLRWVNGVRPIAAVVIIALAIWLLLLKRPGGLRLWLPLLGVLLAVYLATAPLWRGYMAHRIGEEPASSAGYSVTVGFNQQSGGCWNPGDSQLLYSYSDHPGSTAQWTQEQMMKEAKARITSGQIDFPKLMLSKLKTFLGSDDACVGYSSSVLAHTREFSAICNCFHYAVLPLALWGGIKMWRRGTRSAILLAPLFVLGLTLAHMLVEVAGRYHYSIIPMLLLVGQYAWSHWEHPEERSP